MYADLTNVGTSQIFLPGPNVSIDPGETVRISAVDLSSLDGNSVLKEYVRTGVITAAVLYETDDNVAPTVGTLTPSVLPAYTDPVLPIGVVGRVIYVTNALKVGELPGAGTGAPVYYSNGAWRVFSTDAPYAV